MKRFTETGKWEKPWFQDLAPHLKCLWLYICDKADAAGVWEMNWKLASLAIGKTVSESDLKHFTGRAATFGGKLIVGSFIAFQYGKLSPDCRPHIPIFRTIEKHRVSIGYSKAINSLKEQEQEKEEDKEPDKDKEKEQEPDADTPTEWIVTIRAMECYKPLNIDSEIGRANAWCLTNRRKCTQKFFLNWLNRALDNHRTIDNGTSNRRTEADRDRERTGIVNSTVGQNLKRL